MNAYLLGDLNVTQKAHVHTLPPAFPLAPPARRHQPSHRTAAPRNGIPSNGILPNGISYTLAHTFKPELRSLDRFGPNVGSRITLKTSHMSHCHL